MTIKPLILAAALLAALPMTSRAEKVLHPTLENAVKAATASGKLDGSVKFYLAGNTPTGKVTIVDDAIQVTRKANAYRKDALASCDWAMQSALILLQRDAKQAGANAVVGITSNYKDSSYSDPQKYECHVGFLMSGVQLQAKLAKVE